METEVSVSQYNNTIRPFSHFSSYLIAVPNK